MPRIHFGAARVGPNKGKVIAVSEKPTTAGTPHRALSVRGMVIGGLGAAIITASSLYVALKLGALPWPIVFAALLSLFFLKLCGNTNLNEANVTHTAMSAGAMVAGGLAFTIPGYWMLGNKEGIGFWEILLVALMGVAVGLVATAVLRKHFIEKAQLPYPMGVAAAESLKASDESTSKQGKALFGFMGISAIYAAIRDYVLKLPAMIGTANIPGVAFGIYNSPMMFCVGFIIGPVAALVWIIGALIGDFGIVVGGTAAGLWDAASAAGIKSSLGMGLMLGAGVGVLFVQLLPKAFDALRRRRAAEAKVAGKVASRKTVITASLVSAAVACVGALLLGLGLLPSILLVLGTWVAVLMACQSVGQTNIDPMEVFGVMVMLVIQVCCHDVSLLSMFLIAGVVAVACGMTGDVMQDFKAGAILGTNPRDQWIAQAIGAVVGAVVSAVVLVALLGAFGADSFGVDKPFVAAQASVVAALAGGVPNATAFVVGIVIGLVLAAFKLPCMTLGLGVYLPFYLSFTAFLGGMIKFAYDRYSAHKAKKKGVPVEETQGMGLAVASGIIGGESLVGVIGALVVMGMAFFS